MPIYPYSFQLPPLNVQDIPNDGAVGEFLGISAGGVLDWLPVASGGGDMLKSENLSGLTSYPTARTNLGLGTTDSPTFKNLTISTGTITTSAPVTISQTWNALAVAFTALKVNAVSTASAAGSLLLDLQVGGSPKFNVSKTAVATLSVAGGADNSALYFGGANYSVSLTRGATSLDAGVNGDNRISFNVGGGYILLSGRSALAWSDGVATNTGTIDTYLYRDAANTLALRNSTNPQTFNVYGTSSSSNTVYERMFARYDGTALAFQVGTQHLGATARPLEFLTNGVKRFSLAASGSPVATIFSPNNNTANLLVLRNLSETAKFQFYLNGSGNSELYIGASNVLISETGSSYFNGGNVGIGTTAPSSKLEVAGAVSAGSSLSGYQLTNGTTRVSGWGNNQGGSLGGLGLSSTFVVGWSSGVDGGNFGTIDTILLRDEQYHLALRNGTNGQKFSVYGTYPGAAWERFTITAPTSGNVLLGTYKGTGGIARGLEIQTDGVSRWTISTAGHLLAAADNTYDIGASGANRPRNVYSNAGTFGSSGGVILNNYVNIAGGNFVNWLSRSTITSITDGHLTLSNQANTDFNRLQFGGTTASFPAIKRSSTTLQARLADDSAFAPIQGKLTTDTAYTAGAITDTGYIVLYDSTGTAYKVACTPV